MFALILLYERSFYSKQLTRERYAAVCCIIARDGESERYSALDSHERHVDFAYENLRRTIRFRVEEREVSSTFWLRDMKCVVLKNVICDRAAE